MINDQNPKKPMTIVVEPEQVGQRIDNFLVSRLKGLPKSRLYRAIRSGEIRVNKKRIDSDYRVQTGDSIRMPPFRLSARPVEEVKPGHKALQQVSNWIIWEDEHLILLNKPAGIACHGGSGIRFGIVELLRHARPKLKFLELVHRIDRDTTGCLLLAKKPTALKKLQADLREKKIEKIYLAVVHGKWRKSTTVTAPLLKNTLRSGERIVKVHSDGKSAETHFKVLSVGAAGTLIEARLMTGRTHQIRVHAAHAGHPILGDEKYGLKEKSDKACGHLLLHAAMLSFQHPMTQEHISICASLDADFKCYLQQYFRFYENISNSSSS